MRVDVKCPVLPTEDEKAVMTAVANMFPEADIQVSPNKVILVSIDEKHQLDWLRQRVFEQRIIDTVRAQLLRNTNGIKTHLLLGKQASFCGRIHIVDKEENPPLGCIKISFKFQNAKEFEHFIRWFTPNTENGRVVGL